MATFNSMHATPKRIDANLRFDRGGTPPASASRIADSGGPTPLARPLARFGKRSFDIIAATLLLMLLSPLVIVAALNVRRDGGPALYRHDRLGLAGRTFRCLKFRSMHANADNVLAHLLESDPDAAAEWEATHKLRRDPRVTAVGHFIRASSIDELPQLFNVLRGEMGLVGPRPIVQSELLHYGRKADLYLMAKPGLTGLWQVSGRSDTSYQTRVNLDSDYLCNWTFCLDIGIVLETIPVILTRRGAV